MSQSATLLDHKLARLCELCPVCRHARKRQDGLAYIIVRHVETAICPFCRAYERVHGIKAHEARVGLAASDGTEP